jgi:hypothetical protein
VTSTMPNAQALSVYGGTNFQHTVVINNATLNGQVDIGGKDKTTATITGTTFTLPVTYTGTLVDFIGAKMTMTKATFNGGGISLHVSSGEVTVRQSLFKMYYYYGVQVTTAKKVDLGTDAQPGANEFTPSGMNANSYAIYDQRPADINPITVSETTVGGNALPAGMNMGPLNMSPRYYIQTALNVIQVY